MPLFAAPNDMVSAHVFVLQSSKWSVLRAIDDISIFSFISMKSYFLYTQFFSRGAGQGIVIDATCVCDDHSFIHYRFNTTTVCAPKYTNGQIECNSINCSSNSIMLYSLIQLCSTSNSTTFGTLTAYLASVHHQRAHTHKTRSLQTMPLCMIL